jgi:peptidyl-prolyl cis-trans isomerase C
MLKTGTFAALALLGALLVNPAFAEDKSAAVVNGVAIPQSLVDMRIKIAAEQGQQDTPALQKTVLDNMINLEVLSQAAEKAGIDKDPEVIQQTHLAKQSVLVNAFVQDYAKKHPISDDQLKQEYNKLKAHLGTKEYKARHILVDTEAEAKAIIAQLGKKGDFAKIAKEKSKDAGSAAQGGELDWAVPSNFVAPFSKALIALKKGAYTKVPVQSPFGWHIIKLDDVRDLKVPTFDQLKPQLLQRMQQQSIKDFVADLQQGQDRITLTGISKKDTVRCLFFARYTKPVRPAPRPARSVWHALRVIVNLMDNVAISLTVAYRKYFQLKYFCVS